MLCSWQRRRHSMEPHHDERRRRTLTRHIYMMLVSLKSWYAYRARTRLTGAGGNKGGKKEEVTELVKTPALDLVAKSTQKN